MTGPKEYYDSLIAQGYTYEQANSFTQQHFPDFSPAAMPTTLQPMAATMAAPMDGMMLAPQSVTNAMRPLSDSSPIGYIAVACVVISLALSTWGVLGGTWIVVDDDDDIGIELNLTHTTAEYDVRDVFGNDFDCDDFKDYEDEFQDDIGMDIDTTCDGNTLTLKISLSDNCDEEPNDDEICDASTAGLTGKIILWVAIGIGLIAALLISFNVFNIRAIPVDTQKFGMIAGISSGALVAIAVIVWMILMPNLENTDETYGLNVWLTFMAAVTGILAGILTKIHGNPSSL